MQVMSTAHAGLVPMGMVLASALGCLTMRSNRGVILCRLRLHGCLRQRKIGASSNSLVVSS